MEVIFEFCQFSDTTIKEALKMKNNGRNSAEGQEVYESSLYLPLSFL